MGMVLLMPGPSGQKLRPLRFACSWSPKNPPGHRALQTEPGLLAAGVSTSGYSVHPPLRAKLSGSKSSARSGSET